MGSAVTGAGVDRLMVGLTTLLPTATGRPDEPLSATVFKVERGPAGERIAYVRMFAGTLRARTRVHGELVTGIRVFDRGPARPAPQVVAGQIAQLRGPTGLRVGDTLGEPPPPARRAKAHFAPPTLEAVIRPARPGDKGALHAALVDLAEQDPLIGLRQDDDRGELYVSLYGEVQKEVLRAMLDEGHGLAVELLDTTVACVERPVGTGHALEVRGEGGNPFEATVGIEIAPGPEGSGLVVRSIVEVGSIPAAYHAAVATTTRAALRKGLHGWPVIDAVVTVTHCDHRPPPVPVGGFRDLTPIVTREALARAGTVVCEPILRFRLDLPADTAAAVYVALARLGAVPLAQAAAAAGSGRGATIEGEIRAARLPELQQQVPGLTRGEGVLDAAFASYRRVDGPG
jgi:ribosomal protection tetracycline resistance protein